MRKIPASRDSSQWPKLVGYQKRLRPAPTTGPQRKHMYICVCNYLTVIWRGNITLVGPSLSLSFLFSNVQASEFPNALRIHYISLRLFHALTALLLKHCFAASFLSLGQCPVTLTFLWFEEQANINTSRPPRNFKMVILFLLPPPVVGALPGLPFSPRPSSLIILTPFLTWGPDKHPWLRQTILYFPQLLFSN